MDGVKSDKYAQVHWLIALFMLKNLGVQHSAQFYELRREYMARSYDSEFAITWWVIIIYLKSLSESFGTSHIKAAWWA